MTNPEVNRPGIKTRLLNRLGIIRRAIREQFRDASVEFDPIEYVDPNPSPDGPAKFRRGPSF